MTNWTETELIGAFASEFSALPGARVCAIDRNVTIEGRHELDAVAECELGGRKLRLLIEAKRDVFPRDVPEVIWRLRRSERALTEDGAGELLPIVISNALSSGARAILRDDSIGYYDSSGSLYIPAAQALIFVDKPPPKKQRDPFTAIFKGKRAQVLHAVWAQKDGWLTVKEIAHIAGVTAATASNVLSELERRDWMDVEGRGPGKRRRLIAAQTMLDEWQSALVNASPLAIDRYYVPLPNPEEIAQSIGRHADFKGIDHALTGELAAQAISPYLSATAKVIYRIVKGPGVPELLAHIHARPVREGWNLGLISVTATSELALGEMAELSDGNVVRLSTSLQIWLDLLQLPGRAPDLADHFRREALKF